MALDPIRLGSAAASGFIFQSGSSVTTDQHGVQTCNVEALFPDGALVYSAMPTEGTGYSGVFSNSYLPSGFVLDFFEGTPGVTYLEGTVAKVSFKFKRMDPLTATRRLVVVDTIINYENQATSQIILFTNGLLQNNIFGFPDPTATVTYSTATQPAVGTGGLAGLYAPPGSPSAQGFPPVPDIAVPYTFIVSAGSVITYWNGTAFISFMASSTTTFTYNLNFIANPRGWQLTKLKYDPIANRSFFAVEENWRNFYSFQSASFVSHTP